MHLVSTVPQTVRLDGVEIELEPGETIHTENSYKYDLTEFEDLAARGGFEPHTVWSDDRQMFSVLYMTRA